MGPLNISRCKLGEVTVPKESVSIPQETMEFAVSERGEGTGVMAAWSALLQCVDAGEELVVRQLALGEERTAALGERLRKGRRGGDPGRVKDEEVAEPVMGLCEEARLIYQGLLGRETRKVDLLAADEGKGRRARAARSKRRKPLLETEVIQIGSLLIAGDQDTNQEIIDLASESCILPRGAQVKRHKFQRTAYEGAIDSQRK